MISPRASLNCGWTCFSNSLSSNRFGRKPDGHLEAEVAQRELHGPVGQLLDLQVHRAVDAMSIRDRAGCLRDGLRRIPRVYIDIFLYGCFSQFEPPT